MSQFEIALMNVLHHEGGRVNHPLDKGGSTAFGMSLRFLQSLPDLAGDINDDGHVNADDMPSLTASCARRFYFDHFWSHYRLHDIHDQQVATKLFNFFVNMRGQTAALVAQRGANDLGADLVEDGIMGSRSRLAINQLDSHQLLTCIKWRAWEVYRAIVANDLSQNVFINGWRHRAFS